MSKAPEDGNGEQDWKAGGRSDVKDAGRKMVAWLQKELAACQRLGVVQLGARASPRAITNRPNSASPLPRFNGPL